MKRLHLLLLTLTLLACSTQSVVEQDAGVTMTETYSAAASPPTQADCDAVAAAVAKGSSSVLTKTIARCLAYTRTTIVALCLANPLLDGCGATPTPPPSPPSIGGAPSTGGATATGGAVAKGGATGQGGTATGGSVATGGSTAVPFPGCESTKAKKIAPEPRKFGPPTKPLTLMRAVEAAPVTGANVSWTPIDCLPPNVSSASNPCVALNQGNTGSCAGEDACQVSATAPYARTAAQSDALVCYAAGTKLDNGCAWNATAKQCPAAYNPTTGANDTGSYASSTFQAAVYMGWFTGLRPVTQTVQGWHDALLLGPCGFDQNWYNDGFDTDSCGNVAITGALAGGHSTAAIGFDVSGQRMLLRNSWGKWGLNGGFFYHSVADLYILWARGANMVCPAVPKVSSMQLGLEWSSANDNAVKYREAG